MNVTLLATGGTIASTDADGGATPSKRGRELLDAVPELQEYAAFDVEEPVRVPSYEMDATSLETIGDRVRSLDERGDVDAVVVTHGTDTMEETAYYVDVAVQPGTPVLLTGAQRRPDERGSDGPRNLLTAVRAARAFVDRDGSGTFVAFDESVHAAKTATKTHTSRLDAFDSVPAGPVATVDREGVAVTRPPRSETDPVPGTSLDANVFTVKSGSCVTGDLLDAAVERGADGLVVEGTGLGNVTAGVGAAIERAIDGGVPIVVASRCLAGRTSPVYGGEGGGRTLHDHGAILAGDLPAHKARLRLALALDADDDTEAVRGAFD